MSDLTLQARWGQYEEGVNHYDDLTLNVHILYDDYAVLPDPASCVPAYLRTEEVPALLELERAFGPMLADLRDLPDDLYLFSYLQELFDARQYLVDLGHSGFL